MIKQFAILSCKNFVHSKMPFYAVASGRKIGIFETWETCKSQVDGFSNPVYKKFKVRQEAEEFLQSKGVNINKRTATTELIEPIVKKEKLIKHIEKPAVKEFWPDDLEDEDDDDDLLLSAAGIGDCADSKPSRKFKSTNPSSKSGNFKKEFLHKSIVWHPVGVKKIGDYEFPIDSEGFVIVYTDGSCINNGKRNAIAGFGVYFSKDHKLNAAKPVVGRPTNNVGEIQASIYAIKLAKSIGIKKLCVSTDSQFLINSITMWIKYWKNSNWVTKAGEKVKNTVDFKTLDALLSDNSIEIKWNYVRGHNGIEGNECADKLAREGSELYQLLNMP